MGDVNIPKPGAFDFVGKVKWVAWKKIEGTPKESAENDYVSLVDSLLQNEQKSEGSSATMETGTSTSPNAHVCDHRLPVGGFARP